MNGTTNMGGIDLRRQAPHIEGGIPAFPIQSHSESLLIPSRGAKQDASEVFRRGWKAIVGAWHAPDKVIEDNAPAEDSWRDAGITNSVKVTDAVAVSEGRAKTDTDVRATSEVLAEGVSATKSSAPRPGIVLETSPVQDAACAGSNHLPAKRLAVESTSHSPKSWRRNDQFPTQQFPDVQSTAMTAPYSEVMILSASTPMRGISLVAEETSQAKFPALEFANREGNSPDQQDVDGWGSATRKVPSSFAIRRPTGKAGAEVTSEEPTVPAFNSTLLSPEGKNDVPNDSGELISAQKPITGVEQTKPPAINQQSPRSTFSRTPGTMFAGESSMTSDETSEFTLVQGAQIKEPSNAPLKRDAISRDRAAFGAVSLRSPANAATAAYIRNQPVSDTGSASSAQMRSGPVPSFAPAGMGPSRALDASAVSSGRTAPVHETFAAMDAAINDGVNRWIHADSHRAEAGFQDPALGWISVRAQAGTAGIHAAVMPASETAAEVLSGHLAGLNAHMANQYEHMPAVTLSTPITGWNSHETGREQAQGNGAGPSHDGQEQAQENSAPVPSEPVRQFTRAPVNERTNTEPPVYTAGLNLRERHFSFVV